MDAQQRAQVAERIREARKVRGWSQARLAEAAGVSENTVLSMEKGKNAQEGKLRAVLDALGIMPPAEGALTLDGVPEDVQIFLRVAAQRLSVLSPDARDHKLAMLYPQLISDDLGRNGAN
jgi:transcriptional regulator with XRE-family HTH domain